MPDQADSFAPPPGPPPPKVPEGWKAVFNSQYNEWFYVNIHTKQSQWDKPTEPVYPTTSESGPADPPPQYDESPAPATHTGSDKERAKAADLASNNPFSPQNTGSASGSNNPANVTDDERLARQLQAEEDAKRGASDSYYNAGPQGHSPVPGGPSPMPGSASPYGAPQDQYAGADRGKKGGFLGKLLWKSGKAPTGSQPGYYGGPPQQQFGYPQQGYPPQGYPPQGYPPQGYPPHGYPQQGYYGQQPYGQPARRQGGGLGAGGGLALGAGAGLLGGMVMANAMHGNQQDAYQDGYQDGADYDGGGGGDFGGGDFGGGDF